MALCCNGSIFRLGRKDFGSIPKRALAPVTQWIACLTSNQKVMGSSPIRGIYILRYSLMGKCSTEYRKIKVRVLVSHIYI